jgi:ribosome maturation factor RimP
VTGVAVTDLTKSLEDLLEPVAEVHGYELVAVEQAGGRKTPVIRVMIDREGGIDLDAVCEANAWVSDTIDAADPIAGPYTLEVSSPGVDRPLRKRQDFERFAGETATVKIKPTGNPVRSAWTGVLVGLVGDDVTLDVDGESVAIPFDSVLKARLKGVVSFNKERGTL